jgi:YfiH family protein
MFSIFEKYPEIIAIVSTKEDGTMKFNGNLLCDRDVRKNREKFLENYGIEEKLTVMADLVHGNNIKVVSVKEAGKAVEKIDGLITADKNLFLTITVADCLPIFIFDWKKGIIGLVHAGWRGLAKNILSSAVKKMAENFESSPEDILAAIGPGISRCHFEVKQDVLEKFKDFLPEVLLERNKKSFLDLKKIAKIQLINLGLKEENIETSPECAFCLSDKYFSFRRDKALQAMMAVIGRKN